ncbi:MAG: hypothetical protein PHC50_07015 [Candidatus Cloacimonetes bacterium]|nr:hypothetical protein [Candidatus Cloacimonadota bacterium]
MKRILLILMLLLAFIALNASEWEKLLELDTSGVQNADLYYNIGVGYWQDGQSGMANLYFLRALNLDSNHRAAKENLEYVIELSPDKSLYPQRQFLVSAFWQFYDFLTLNRLALISLVLFALFAAAWVWLLNYPLEKERGLPELVLGIMLFLFLGSASLLGIKAYRRAYNNKAVMISQQEFLRQSIQSDSEKLMMLHEGVVLELIRTGKESHLVRTPDGVKGWLPAASIRMVTETHTN